ncbi:MAG: hypothetical protein P4L40_04305, partial [Terracidiphilus sp.]|nr:hypothetical protein [Terracidiphilus sp.]
MEEVLSFNIVLHAATIDCTTVSSWNTTLVDLGSLTARLGALFSVDPAHMSLRAMGCASDAGTVGGNTRRLSGAVITVGFKLSYLTSAAADAVQSALATVVAYIPTVVVKGVVMSLTSAKAVAVTNACASSCLSCQDLTATACTRCATGYELEGPSPARCVVASVANGITSAS